MLTASRPTSNHLRVDNPTPTGTGSQTLTLAGGNVTAGDGTVVAPLATNAPITVGNTAGANMETVTPSVLYRAQLLPFTTLAR